MVRRGLAWHGTAGPGTARQGQAGRGQAGRGEARAVYSGLSIQTSGLSGGNTERTGQA